MKTKTPKLPPGPPIAGDHKSKGKGTPGKITRAFIMACAVCEEEVMKTSTSIDTFIETMEKEGWRLSRDHGWSHKKCCKQMPLTIKL